jgi:hypothetical protein
MIHRFETLDFHGDRWIKRKRRNPQRARRSPSSEAKKNREGVKFSALQLLTLVLSVLSVETLLIDDS